MSVRIMAEVWDTDLPKNLKMLLLAMADHANDLGASIHPGVVRLAAKTSDSPRNVTRLLRKLEDLELIVATGYRAGGFGKATRWRIDLEELAKHQPRQIGTLSPLVENPVENPVETMGTTRRKDDTTRAQP